MKKFFIDSLNGMALGLFSSLIIGLIIKQIGLLFSIDLLINLGTFSQLLMAPAIGVGVSYSLKMPALIIIASAITGAFGAGSINLLDNLYTIKIGEPIGAYFATIFGSLIASKMVKKTKFDIIILPAVTIILGCLAANFFTPFLSEIIKSIGYIINKSTELNPILMGMLVSSLMGILLTMPTSSAAIGISLGLNGLAAGAALAGCCSQMIGFAVMSYEDNDLGSSLSIAFGTSMIQFPNIIKNPLIWCPPILSSSILGVLSTTIFKLESNSIASGMGTSGLVGQIATFSQLGKIAIFPMLLLHFIFPIILNLLIYKYMRGRNLIKKDDLKIY